ncbi:hypothetical protein CPAR01_15425 [Colletotrichum paranaense]|uniref:FAD-binding PCMH-type domain-containing protein n=1 Tax=Colletotrichum paranaense TaxID=1914294 RepID=A0ABQ9RZ61_9PEZI|nr:uncharacterized protein CPAR01_15425 [Colletotrichum paranaense]KAK1519932.1 hypothetical protein CPAR01_15425 [Colletotrichum paranaense]
MQLSLLLAAFSAHAVLAAPRIKRDALKSCVEEVFGGNAALRIVTPTDPTYHDARIGEAIQFTQMPVLIAYAEKPYEVAPLIQCAKTSGIKAVPRTGGHHFLGYSALQDALVIDITHIDYVNIAADKKTATVGAGIRFGALYTALGQQGLDWTGGICPTVGISGFLSAGGFNMQMRQNGLGVDNVESAKVVTSDGCIVTASRDENADLFFAIRGGGGGSYGIVIEWTLRMYEFPRSAMVYLQWNGSDTRFDIAKTFHEWAPRADSALSSQVNLYKNRTDVIGWCYGCTLDKLQGMVNASGLLGVGKPAAYISGGCNTINARLFGYGVNECGADEAVAQVAPFVVNTIQQPFVQIPGYANFTYNETTKAPELPPAQPWARFIRLSKSFMVQKDKLLTDETMKNAISRIDELDDAAQGWIEWHAWNISIAGDAAFAWREQAYSHMEFIVSSSADEKVHAGYVKWFKSLEDYLRPLVGMASYSGYMDDTISTPPLDSYYGANVAKLSQIKSKYDPQGFFANSHPQNSHLLLVMSPTDQRPRQPQTIIWLKTSDQSFAIHKSLLVESSKYFQRCLDGPFAESHTNTIDLNDTDDNADENDGEVNVSISPLTLGTYVKLCYFTRLTAQRVKRCRRNAADHPGEDAVYYEVSPFSLKPCDMHTPHDLTELVDMWSLCDRFHDDLLLGKVSTAIRETLDVGATKLGGSCGGGGGGDAQQQHGAEWWVFNFANGYVALASLHRRRDDDVEGLMERLRDLFVQNCSPASWERLAGQLPSEFVVAASIAFQAKMATLMPHEAAIARVNGASLCYECKTRVQTALKR